MNNKYNLKPPIYCLAPMANITTYPFASQAAKFGADLVWTPMVHTDTIIHNWEEAKKILDFHPLPYYIVQIVGQDPQKFAQATKIIENGLSPLGLDINFACPDKNIVKSGCGGALMQNTSLILEILKAVKDTTNLPISVKTRVGWDNKTDIFNIAEQLADKVDMLTVHGRTVKQGFTGEADWNVIGELKKAFPGLKIVGSGDVKSWQEALEIQSKTNVDGVMIGRGALGRPWIFKEIKEENNYDTNELEIKQLALDLAQKADAIWGDRGITESKKHFAWYFRGFPGAVEYRKALMLAQTLEDVTEVLT